MLEEKWNPEVYKRINKLEVYVPYEGLKVNKYPCGTSILQFPFFTWTYLTHALEGTENDGYQKYYHKSVFYAAVFYLFLTLVFLKLLLLLYEIDRINIHLIQFLLVFATSVTHYTSADAGFSHIYSLFAITLFFYLVKSYFYQKSFSKILSICIVFALIFLLRNINILILFFIPFLANDFNSLKSEIVYLVKKPKWLIVGGIVSFLIASIQMVLWYLQTGHFLVYSYQGEGFNFLSPHFIDILFSYQKGLFIYAPILLVSFLGVFVLFKRKNYFHFITWTAFFIFLTYILSSWWSWFYGCSYGLRAFIDFYPVFFIPFAFLLQALKPIPKALLSVICLITVPINIIQTYQYSNFILHWAEMDKDKYWKVFLKTEKKYEGLLWKQKYNLDYFNLEAQKEIPSVQLDKHQTKDVFNLKIEEIPNMKNVNLIVLEMEDVFHQTENSQIILKIDNESKVHFWHQFYLLRLLENNFEQNQLGKYYFEFKKIDEPGQLTLTYLTQDHSKKFNNAKLKFYSLK